MSIVRHGQQTTGVCNSRMLSASIVHCPTDGQVGGTRRARIGSPLSGQGEGKGEVVQGNWRMLDPTPLTSMLSPSKGRGELSDGGIILSLPRSKRAVAFIEIDC